jgi:hypothetical protein
MTTQDEVCMELTQARMRELFDYRDGFLYWKVKPSRDTTVGACAGTERKDGYRVVRYQRRGYLAHRLIYLMHHGEIPQYIDHIDRNPRNNRVENLRAAAHSQNHANRSRQSNNKSGFKGVHWCKRDKKYIAKIKSNGKQITIGYFTEPEEAHKAYQKAAQYLNGEFARAA